MSKSRQKSKRYSLGMTGLLAFFLFAGSLVNGAQAQAHLVETPAIVADSKAVYSSFSGQSGCLVRVVSGSFEVNTETPVTFTGDWGAVTIPAGNVLVEVGATELQVTVIRGSASVDSQVGEPGLALIAEGESRVWTEVAGDPVLTSLGMSE